MFILWVALPLYIPLFDCPDHLTLISLSKLHLDLIASSRIRILQQKIETAGMRLDALLVLENEIAETENSWVLRDDILHPPLIQLRMSFDPESLWSLIC